MNDKTVSQVLREAADLVDEGWCKNLLAVTDGQGRILKCCARGAIHQVVTGKPWWPERDVDVNRVSAIEDALKPVIGKDITIVEFNNYIAKTASDVSAAMRIAADLAE